ncbi:MarR family winged helix-turn-helix transcriptional regulator [Lacticaseibacillus saniviri]
MATADEFDQLVATFLKINNELTQIQKKPIAITDTVRISTSALHLIDTISRFPASTITDLAQKMGVTKGNISQQLTKLKALNLISISQASDNKKNKLISLTDSGKTVDQAHQSLHTALYQTIKTDLTHFSDDQIHIMLDVLEKIATSINTYQQQLSKGAQQDD